MVNSSKLIEKEYAKRLDDLNKGSYANKRLKELLLYY